ncbi:unnamed protein product [Schistosoma margrebowiei]|uniref:Uncharacterized protein n=1 Tax=Schistosoma margrebowiei TaxID=48269 RepID=A0A183NAG1_9TREM|nr:unnamed protein product [Schistosoma margrebowiei]
MELMGGIIDKFRLIRLNRIPSVTRILPYNLINLQATSRQIPAQLRDQSHENTDYEMKMIKGTQQLNIESSGVNQMITESILETDNLEQNLHSLISTVIGIIDEQINRPNLPW